MRFAAVSDLHLGFRAFAATEGGRNVRELDVERAWVRAQDTIIAHRPAVVFVPGDVFDSPRPSLHAVKAWRDGVRRILRETNAEIVAIPGNHDAGRTAAALSPIVIPDDLPGFHVALEARRIHLELARERVAIACLPYNARSEGKSYRLEPDLDADENVLLIHAPVQGSPDADRVPFFYAGQESIDVGRAAERFGLVVAGDFHEQRWLHPSRRAFYPGSIERTSSNIWQERDEKGVVVGCSSSRGAIEFVPHDTRPVHDVRVSDFDIDLELPSAYEVNACLAEINETWGISDRAIARLLVEDFPRGERDRIRWDLVRELKHRLTHFQLDLRFAGADRRDPSSAAPNRGGRPRSLLEQARAFMEGEPEEVQACVIAHLARDGEPLGLLLPPGDVLLLCPECGNRDSIPPGFTTAQPCSAGCGATMEPEPPQDVEVAV